MSKETEENISSKIPVQYLVQKMEFYKRELAKEDDREILREKTIQYYTTGKGKESWMYLQTPEEIYEDTEYGRAMVRVCTVDLKGSFLSHFTGISTLFRTFGGDKGGIFLLSVNDNQDAIMQEQLRFTQSFIYHF